MIILWIRKNKGEKHNLLDKGSTENFQEHDEIMKKFRFSHPDLAVTNPRDIMTDDGMLLYPMNPIELWENIQN